MPCDQNDPNDYAAQNPAKHWNPEAREIERHRSDQHNNDNRRTDSAAHTDSIDPDFGVLIVVAHAGSIVLFTGYVRTRRGARVAAQRDRTKGRISARRLTST